MKEAETAVLQCRRMSLLPPDSYIILFASTSSPTQKTGGLSITNNSPERLDVGFNLPAISCISVHSISALLRDWKTSLIRMVVIGTSVWEYPATGRLRSAKR